MTAKTLGISIGERLKSFQDRLETKIKVNESVQDLQKPHSEGDPDLQELHSEVGDLRNKLFDEVKAFASFFLELALIVESIQGKNKQ